MFRHFLAGAWLKGAQISFWFTQAPETAAGSRKTLF
jgi:hypothetical protein